MAGVKVRVMDHGSKVSPKLGVEGALISIDGKEMGKTDAYGELDLKLTDGKHTIGTKVFGIQTTNNFSVPRKGPVRLSVPIGASITVVGGAEEVMEGERVQLRADIDPKVTSELGYLWGLLSPAVQHQTAVVWYTTGAVGDEPTTEEIVVKIMDTETGATVSPKLYLEVVPRTEETGTELRHGSELHVRQRQMEERTPSIESEDSPVSENDSVDNRNDEQDTPQPGGNGGARGSGGTHGNGGTRGNGGGNGKTQTNGAGRFVPSVSVTLDRTRIRETPDEILWTAIRNRTNAIRFSGSGYADFINQVLCNGDEELVSGTNAEKLSRQRRELYAPIHGVGAYELLKTATQVFLLLECGAVIKETDASGDPLYNATEEGQRLLGSGRSLSFDEAEEKLKLYLGDTRLPYVNRVLRTAFSWRRDVDVERTTSDNIFCEGYLGGRANCPPMLELIWSYWHEEAMLVQTMKAISLRFQNRHSKGDRDPLANLEIAPLYPLNNLLWGYIQDEVHLLSVARRNYEYSHHYGIGLYGQAISNFRPAESRSHFLEGFHNLLYRTSLFYKQDDDNTYSADGFPVLNALREVHLTLAQGAGNQAGDLTWEARAEMLTEQWLLSRPEMRLFLQSRDMVPYRETWMPQVDAMKQMQGWTDTSVTHFNFLAVHGEQLLLSIRWGDWVDITDPASAANWARYWRPEIQNYIHAYRAATGVDLAADASDSRQAKLMVTPPSELLRQRLEEGAAASSPRTTSVPEAPKRFRERRATRVSANGRQ